MLLVILAVRNLRSFTKGKTRQSMSFDTNKKKLEEKVEVSEAISYQNFEQLNRMCDLMTGGPNNTIGYLLY